MITNLLYLYIGFTIGLCLMDYISVYNIKLNLYKVSPFNLVISLFLSPFVFPIYFIILIKNKVKEYYDKLSLQKF